MSSAPLPRARAPAHTHTSWPRYTYTLYILRECGDACTFRAAPLTLPFRRPTIRNTCSPPPIPLCRATSHARSHATHSNYPPPPTVPPPSQIAPTPLAARPSTSRSSTPMCTRVSATQRWSAAARRSATTSCRRRRSTPSWCSSGTSGGRCRSWYDVVVEGTESARPKR